MKVKSVRAGEYTAPPGDQQNVNFRKSCTQWLSLVSNEASISKSLGRCNCFSMFEVCYLSTFCLDLATGSGGGHALSYMGMIINGAYCRCILQIQNVYRSVFILSPGCV